MNKASFLEKVEYKADKPAISVLMETEFTKEIRIAMKKGQNMKKHQTPFPIVVQIVAGKINFGLENQEIVLSHGDLVSLPGAVPHNLLAEEDSVVRLTLVKSDQVERVKQVVAN